MLLDEDSSDVLRDVNTPAALNQGPVLVLIPTQPEVGCRAAAGEDVGGFLLIAFHLQSESDLELVKRLYVNELLKALPKTHTKLRCVLFAYDESALLQALHCEWEANQREKRAEAEARHRAYLEDAKFRLLHYPRQ